MALFEDHPAAALVSGPIEQGEAVVCAINLGEVLYRLERDHGRERALALVDGIREITRVEEPDWELVTAAAHVKAGGGLSYADAFCVATAERHGAPLYTGDPEILALGRSLPLQTVDLRLV